ncbi:hypothetical protein [Actinophytocola sp.]|uniref:hypothetical protein n=1 Tax=Actinophytocola sp. TaxID=1872138 RepID=UPI002ED4047A
MRVPALVRALCVVTGVVVAGGCTSDAEPAHTPSRVPAERMSDDVFHSDEISLIEYTKNKLIADCLERNGYPEKNQAGVQEHPGTFDYLVPKASDWATRSDEQARLLGFGENSPAEAARVMGLEEGYTKASDDCRAEAAAELGPDSVETVSQASEFANSIASEIAAVLYDGDGAEAKELTSLYVPVMDCLETKGYRPSQQGERNLEAYGAFEKKGRLEGPEPARPAPASGRITVLPPVPERRYVPAPEEAELAVSLAQCARQTGFADKEFALRLRVTRAAIGKYEAELTELTPKVEALAKRAAKLVGQ